MDKVNFRGAVPQATDTKANKSNVAQKKQSIISPLGKVKPISAYDEEGKQSKKVNKTFSKRAQILENEVFDNLPSPSTIAKRTPYQSPRRSSPYVEQVSKPNRRTNLVSQIAYNEVASLRQDMQPKSAHGSGDYTWLYDEPTSKPTPSDQPENDDEVSDGYSSDEEVFDVDREYAQNPVKPSVMKKGLDLTIDLSKLGISDDRPNIVVSSSDAPLLDVDAIMSMEFDRRTSKKPARKQTRSDSTTEDENVVSDEGEYSDEGDSIDKPKIVDHQDKSREVS